MISMKKTERASSSSGEKKNGTNSIIGFPNFDICSDCVDHYFINQTQFSKKDFANENKPIYKKIMQEWRILEKNLPESIYVRVYEDRMDLLRAAIVGAPQTPYHDGLFFFFDILFPSDYPNEPPRVHYHSHGLRLNPNLYKDGFLCLSLINTWHGSGREKWRSDMSTVLQLLVSIQGLVLNEKPMWNEPEAYDMHRKMSSEEEMAKKNGYYNEQVFLLSCKTMLFTIAKPPKSFEALVFDHFRTRKDFILGAFKAYRDGVWTVGCYRNDGSSSSSSTNRSGKFKSDSEVVYGKLVTALARVANMATVDELKGHIVVKNPTTLIIAGPAKAKAKTGILNNIFKCFLG